MRVNPNYSEAFEMVSPGKYKAKIVDVEGKTSQANNRYLNWKLELQPSKMVIYYVTMIEGKASGMLKHFTKCVLGEQYEDGELETDAFLGHSVLVDLHLVKNEYNGEMREFLKVKQVERLTVMNEPQPIQDDIAF